MAEQIEVKLSRNDYLSMRDKTFTPVMSYVTWFGSHIEVPQKLINIFSRMAGQIEGNFTHMFPKTWGYHSVHELIHVTWSGSHIGLNKILTKNYFS